MVTIWSVISFFTISLKMVTFYRKRPTAPSLESTWMTLAVRIMRSR